MYIELSLPKSLYVEVLRRRQADLRAAAARRSELLARLKTMEEEVAQLQRLIRNAQARLDELANQADVQFGSHGRAAKKPLS